MDDYKEALKIDKEKSGAYYSQSIRHKTEQQKFLEERLSIRAGQPATIADIACGGGGVSYYLSQIYPQAQFTLIDANEDALALAREATGHLNATCSVGNVYDLALETGSFDIVICWQTLSWLSEPEIALRELIRICKPGGVILASSLFNAHHDVDVYSTVFDHTRPSAIEGYSYAYNTYSISTIRKWVSGLVSEIQLHEFDMPINLEYAERGLGTYTAMLDNGKRLQISAGMLLNWGVLELEK